ncbi:hypothetical protein BCR42DRAFT_491876 [Absidia repens]|uniref:Uncharacterized protein n=1 Tax=Absidia repens TaxID=90262 RepID=A0A1X2IHQ4_9FUNG|nr:hypothetical protein BCR42DRAFT_491876 [Absidia repens]
MTKDQYICRRAANAILSEIGPYQISSDALQTINQFLDQVLALLLQNTQSLQLSRVKSHLLTLLPLNLGKNAIVEAELEVKTHCETNNVYYQLYTESANETTPFLLDQTWTSLRYRCIEYSTLTDKAPDSPTRNNNGDNELQGMELPPVVIIYFTAVLEHIAEYILTIVAIIAEQEDTKYIRIKEVYSALLNDVQVGGLFKQTDLRSKLEKRVLSYQTQQHLHPYPPINLPSPSPSPVTSFKNQVSVTGNIDYEASELYYDHDQDDDLRPESPLSTHSRTSSSIKSGQSSSHYRPVSVLSNVTSSSNRSSSSSKRTFRFFGKKEKRPSTPTATTHHQQEHRTKSPPPPSRPSTQIPPPSSVQVHDLSAPALDFEDLMRSGNTIKVSLTPNRLRSIEVKPSTPTTKKTGIFDSSPSAPPPIISNSGNSSPISSPTLSHPTPLRAFPPNGTPFENPRAAPKPPIVATSHYQPKNFETPPLTPDSSIASRLSTTRSPSPSFEEEQQQQQQRTTTINARYGKQASLTPLQLAGRSPHSHRKQASVDTLSTDVCAMDLPSPPSTMDHHPPIFNNSNDNQVTTNTIIASNKPVYIRPSSMVAKRAASGMARPVSCHENFAMTMGSTAHKFDTPTRLPPQPQPFASKIVDSGNNNSIVRTTTMIMRQRPSSPVILEEEEEEEEDEKTKKALDAGTTTKRSLRNTTMVNAAMQTEPLPGLPPLASLLATTTDTTTSSITIPTLIVTPDDPQQQQRQAPQKMMTMQHMRTNDDNDNDGDDDEEEEWFLEDDDWDDVQDQDSVMAEWLLGES